MKEELRPMNYHDTVIEKGATEATKETSRWTSMEFYGHYMMIAQALFFGFKAVYEFSSQNHPAHSKYSVFLSDGWIPGRSIDLSDRQYGAFRRNMPPLSGLLLVYLALSYAVRRTNGDIGFRCILSMIFIFILHGFNIVKILFIAGINYLIALRCSAKYRPALVWSWGLLVLFATEWIEFPFFPASLFSGFYKRWNIVFKITVLRMISFGMDFHWFSQEGHYNENRALHKQSCKLCSVGEECEKYQTQFGCKDQTDFEWPQYLSYLFYPPLYLAGPIITFHSFTKQIKQPVVVTKAVVGYCIRFLICFVSLDVLLHFCYVVAIKESKAFIKLTALDFGMLGFFNLKIIWFKLLIIWRYFRMVAMMDGISVPENMLRCMSNNYSGMAFWRSWHRSFYLWIVRYLYIPLGGSKTVLWNMWPVFMFVAVWHDLRLNLLAWSWLICLFFLPEIAAGWLSRRLRMHEWHNYRVISGIAATASICMMMTANLVGFAVGLDGLKLLMSSIVTWNGALFMINALCTMYSAAQIMFEVRSTEIRHGLNNNF